MPANIVIELDPEMCADDIAGVIASTDRGRVRLAATILERHADHWVVSGLMIYGDGIGANDLSVALLRRIGWAILEAFNVDYILVRDSYRVSGANPGRKLPDFRFGKKAASAPAG